jgi:uncharacterized protein (DUF2147 family)
MNRFVLRVWLCVFACLAFTFATAAEELKEQDIFGNWVFPENGTLIRFYRCGEGVCGKITKVADPSRRDVHNPDPKLRNRPIVGIVLFSSVSKKGPTTWRGKLYNTLDGSTYEGTLNLLDKNKFVVVGCIFGNLLCDAKTFIRGDEPKPAVAKAEPPTRGGAPASDRAVPPAPSRAAPRPEPTRADFDAFLSSRGSSLTAIRTTEQRELLFAQFLAWWEKRGTAGRTAPN